MNLVKKEISINDLRCWLPTFLPYVGEDGVINYNSYELPNGSWGKIIPNIKVPVDISIEYQTDIIKGGEDIQYRKLMSIYYSILKNGEAVKYLTFIKFVEDINSLYSTEELEFDEACLDVPQKFFLIEKDKYIQELTFIKNSLTLLENKEKTKFTKTEKLRFIELSVEYKRKGGDVFLNYLNSLPSRKEESERLKVYVSEVKYPYLTFDVFFGYKQNDLGFSEPLNLIWKGGVRYYGGDIVQYNGESYICTCEDDVYTEGVYDNESGRLAFDYENFTLIKDIDKLITPNDIFGNVHSTENISYDIWSNKRLKEFKTHTTYKNLIDEIEIPFIGNEDWLFYYRKGVVRSTYTRDENDNIEHYGFDKTDGKDLVVYGSGISDISVNRDKMELVIEYFIDSHLIADFLRVEVDEFNREKYIYTNFRLDKETKYSSVSNGCVYTETFNIKEGSDLYKLIEGTLDVQYTFEEYVNNPNIIDYYKFEFYDVTYSGLTQTKHIKTNKTDYVYDYMIKSGKNIGLMHDNGISDYTDFDRGETKFFESHIKFSEIKNYEELSMYSNGGFYKVEEV